MKKALILLVAAALCANSVIAATRFRRHVDKDCDGDRDSYRSRSSHHKCHKPKYEDREDECEHEEDPEECRRVFKPLEAV